MTKYIAKTEVHSPSGKNPTIPAHPKVKDNPDGNREDRDLVNI
jgi:hypothetical protein